MRKSLFFIVFLAIVAGGYAFWWHYQAERTQEIVERELKSLQTSLATGGAGTQFAYAGITRGGFPLRTDIIVEQPTLSFGAVPGASGPAMELSMPSILVTRGMLELLTYDVHLPAEIVTRLMPPGAAPLKQVTRYGAPPRVRVTFRNDGTLRLFEYEDGGSVTALEGAGDLASIGAMRVFFAQEPLPEAEGRLPGSERIDLKIAMRDAKMLETSLENVPPALASLWKHYTSLGAMRFEADLRFEGQVAEQEQGAQPGTLTIEQVAFTTERYAFDMKGHVSVSPGALLPEARMEMRLVDPEALIETMVGAYHLEMESAPYRPDGVRRQPIAPGQLQTLKDFLRALSDDPESMKKEMRITATSDGKGGFRVGTLTFPQLLMLFQQQVMPVFMTTP